MSKGRIAALIILLGLATLGCENDVSHEHTTQTCQAHGMLPVGVTYEQGQWEYVCYTESPCKFYAYNAEAEDKKTR